MQTIETIKSRIGQQGAEKLGEFLSIPAEKVITSLGEAMNAMLNGLVNITQSEGSAARILKVINDGGHSGDLVEDLDGLFGNKDKLQLLITIGQNINNHFFHSKTPVMVDAIAHVNGVSKSTANSMFSLSAPLVLGALGKMVRTEQLTTAEFSTRLLSDSENRNLRVAQSPQPVVTPEPTPAPKPVVEYAKTVEEPSNVENEPVYQRPVRKKQEANYNWLAWLLLAVLGVAALYFGLKDRFNPSGDMSLDQNTEDTTAYQAPGDVFEDLKTENSTSDKEPQKENSVLGYLDSKNKPESKSTGNSTESQLSRKSASENNSSSSSRSGRKDYTNMENAEVLPSGAVFLAPEEEPFSLEASTDSRPMSFKMNSLGSYFSINGLSFKSTSAEIVDEGELDKLVQYMKENPSVKIEIAGAGNGQKAIDRAYALRGKLYEKGIPAPQMKVTEGVSQNDGPVFVKII